MLNQLNQKREEEILGSVTKEIIKQTEKSQTTDQYIYLVAVLVYFTFYFQSVLQSATVVHNATEREMKKMRNLTETGREDFSKKFRALGKIPGK